MPAGRDPPAYGKSGCNGTFHRLLCPTHLRYRVMDKSRKTAQQAARFLLVSSVSLCIDYGIYSLLTHGFGMDSSWAKRISFACLFFWGYFAHKRFTFRQGGFHPSEPARFGLLYLSGWIINSVVHDLTAAEPNASNPAFLVATFAWACWNFCGQKFFVFRAHPSKARNRGRAI